MQDINNLLDKVRESCSIPSDNALSKKIGVTRALVSGWRMGRYSIPDERIAQLCAMAKLDGPEWLARIHAERAQSPAERALWSKMLARLAAAAIVLAPLAAQAHANQTAGDLGSATPITYRRWKKAGKGAYLRLISAIFGNRHNSISLALT